MPVVATGTSLIELTKTVIVWESVWLPSLTLTVNISLPKKSEDALNKIVLSSITAIISVPSLILNSRLSPSTSPADKLIWSDSSSSKLTSSIVS